MKPILPILLIFILVNPLNAQSLDRYSINSAGGLLSSQDMILSITIGQSGLAGLLEDTTLNLHVGFQQLNSVQTTSVTYLGHQIDFHLFPIPFFDKLNLRLYLDQPAELHINLYNSIGQTMLSMFQDLSAGLRIIPIHPEVVSPGLYFIHVKLKTISGQIYQTAVPVIHSQ